MVIINPCSAEAEELFSGQYNSIAVGVIYCDVFISTDTEYYYNCDLMCVPLEIAMSGRNRFHVHTLGPQLNQQQPGKETPRHMRNYSIRVTCNWRR